MAKKPTPRAPKKKAAGRKKAAGDRRARAIRAALDLAATETWPRVTLDAVAAKAGLTPEILAEHFRSKRDLVNAIMGQVDDRMVAGGVYGVGDAESVRDRLFDVLMRRFEAMTPDKAAYRSILEGSARDPKSALAMLCRFRRVMALTLETAGLSAAGPCGMLKAKGLGAVYLCALATFFKDDAPDMAKTMAALDKGLRRAGAVAEWLAGLTPPKPGTRPA